MSWRPPTTAPTPPHRVNRYGFRVGDLSRPDDKDTSYALVLPMAVWTHSGGHLWWRRWSDPYVEVEVWISADWVQEAYADGWWQRDALQDELDLWDSGQMTVGNDTRRAVRWLDDQTSARVAQQVFNADLAALRAERTGPVP